MCFCFDENVLARSPQQAVRARLEVLGVLQQVFHMFRFIAECGEMYREQFFWRNKRSKSDESLFSLVKLIYRVEKQQQL